MSLWPNGDVKEDFGWLKTLGGVPGCLVLHHDYDRYLEGRRDPKQYEVDYVSPKKVNTVYEEILNYNDITPDRVTLDSVEETTKRWLLNGKEPPEISLSKTPYSFEGEYFHTKDFYTNKQSCTTFCLGLLLNSGAPNHGPSIYDSRTRETGVLAEIIEIPAFQGMIERKLEIQFCSIF